MKWWQKNKGFVLNFTIFLFLFFLSGWLLRPILGEDLFFPSHDSTWLVRLHQFDRAIKLGQFPPRLAPEAGFGFGYPLFRFYAPLFTFLSWLFLKISGSYSLATTFAIWLANFLGAWGMFLLGEIFWGKAGGLVAAVAFLLLPYRALDLYVRGALAELLALNILPWLFYFWIRLFFVDWREKSERGILVGFSLSLVFLLLSHNLYFLMTLLLSPLLLISVFGLNNEKKKQLAKGLFLSLLGALLFSSWYWLPLVSGMNEVATLEQAQKTDYRDHFVYLQQVWNSSWGFGGSAAGLKDGMSFKAGKLQIILFFLGLAALRELKKKKRWLLFSFFLLGITSLFLTLPLSAFIWRLVPLLPVVQFPWRFLGFLGFVLALFSGGVLLFLRSKKLFSWLSALFLIAGLMFLNLKYFSPQKVISGAEAHFITSQKINELVFQVAEYFPRGVKMLPEKQPKETVETEEKQIILDSPYKIIFKVKGPGKIIINRFCFSGWRLFKGKKELPFTKGNLYGRIVFRAPEEGEYTLVFKPTLEEKVGFVLTIIGLLFTFIFLIY